MLIQKGIITCNYLFINYTTLHSDWLFNTQSRVLQAPGRLILENNEKATSHIYIPY
mgnify:CR=1 FL=1